VHFFRANKLEYNRITEVGYGLGQGICITGPRGWANAVTYMNLAESMALQNKNKISSTLQKACFRKQSPQEIIVRKTSGRY